MTNGEIYLELGKALREQRIKKGLSMVEVAETLGVHYSTIQYRESGKRKMNIDDFDLHCKAIGIDNWIKFMNDALEGK